ncbi:GL18786 [Drosophila persimilis]|uniref:Cytochrome b5-related protein n=1 Tax=Drosophila persimilis TaxID=7234 RepID=B4G8Q3_DROPE|nr:cytochrome b5-related protein [Drosophila persimilis]XP_026844177.1 cytochrome b5-related protein [Drosophila persimilis]EDW28733.1 GL18786 [Drosophila persimilis]
MTPNIEEEAWRVSGISKNYPSYRQHQPATVESWLEGKHSDDGAEGLWRINDKLYDLSDFATRHPGGAYWIECTRGTDITEPFESHHIEDRARQLLSKFEVREAAQPRNYKFTFDQNGFYMTLKRRVREKLRKMNYSPTKKTDYLHSGILASVFMLSWIGTVLKSLFVLSIAGLALCWLANAAHNYFHQRDNWRMYTFNLTLMSFRNWRISHALSHHVYPNSLHDLELSMFEPFLCWVPNPHYGSRIKRWISVVVSPLYYVLSFSMAFLQRLVISLAKKNIMYWDDLIAFTLPLFLYLSTGVGLGAALWNWLHVLAVGAFFFGFIGLTAAHHDPRILHDGDAQRTDRDWGLYQMDTVIDRRDVKWSDLLVLTHFGDHALHHLFPTLDHGVLKHLYPELNQTIQEFDAELREMNHWGHIKGQTQQLLRMEANPMPPGSKKFM